MPKIQVSVTEEQMAELKQEVREEFERGWSHEKLLEFMKTTASISLRELMWKYDITSRYEALRDIPVKDLSDHEKFIVATYWMMYESFGRR